MFTKVERLISSRNLKPKKKEGFLKIISIFSLLVIMLGVAILIIVMSVMNGFKTDLTKKILGLNPHVVIEPNSFKINEEYISKLKNNFQEIIRVNEKIYKNLNDNEKIHTFENIINLVIKYPILLQRPIISIERNKKITQSIICRPTELIKSIFS